jgi:hypothetical protein
LLRKRPIRTHRRPGGDALRRVSQWSVGRGLVVWIRSEAPLPLRALFRRQRRVARSRRPRQGGGRGGGGSGGGAASSAAASAGASGGASGTMLPSGCRIPRVTGMTSIGTVERVPHPALSAQVQPLHRRVPFCGRAREARRHRRLMNGVASRRISSCSFKFLPGIRAGWNRERIRSPARRGSFTMIIRPAAARAVRGIPRRPE